MFHKHLRERIGILEEAIVQLYDGRTHDIQAAQKRDEKLKDHSTRLENLWTYILHIEEYVRFGAPGKIKVKYGDNTIALPVQDVLDAIINHLGLEYAPGKMEVATPGKLVVKKDWE